MTKEVKESFKVPVCEMRPETQTYKTRVLECKEETRTRKVQVTTCKTVAEVVTERVPVTTCVRVPIGPPPPAEAAPMPKAKSE